MTRKISVQVQYIGDFFLNVFHLRVVGFTIAKPMDILIAGCCGSRL
jgi:hypothetical protein